MIPDSTDVVVLSHPTEDSGHGLRELACALGAKEEPPGPECRKAAGARRADRASGSRPRAIAATLPEQAIVMDEGITAGAGFYPATMNAPAHTYLQENGGAIGMGLAGFPRRRHRLSGPQGPETSKATAAASTRSRRCGARSAKASTS